MDPEARDASRGGSGLAIAITAAAALAALCLMPLIGSTSIDYGRALRRPLAGSRNPVLDAAAPRAAGAACGRNAGRGRACSSRRCCATRWRRLTRWAYRAALRSARCSPSVSAGARSATCPASGWRPLRARRWCCCWWSAIASEGRRMSSFTLLLAGISINTMCLAAILFLQYISELRADVRDRALADGRHRLGGVLDAGLVRGPGAAGGRRW